MFSTARRYFHRSPLTAAQVRVAQLDKEAAELRDENVTLGQKVASLEEQQAASREYAAQVRDQQNR